MSLITFPLCAQQSATPYHGKCDTDWQRLADGLHYRAIRCLGASDDVDVHAIRVDLAKWKLETAVVERGSARAIARDHDAAFAVNANFFDRPQKPLGAIVRDGSVVQPPRKSSWQSIFLVADDGTPRIVMPSRWKSWRDRTLVAVQAGPRLVAAGQMKKVNKGYAAARTGVCIRKDGDVVFFATPQGRKFDMHAVARVARRDEADGGLACRDAMLFDGGHSTQIYVDAGDKRVDVRGDPVPVFIYATRGR